ncbi:hypothetical protein PFISCL1PPCAC_18746, partial [Pristionchus fissidentatus]
GADLSQSAMASCIDQRVNTERKGCTTTTSTLVYSKGVEGVAKIRSTILNGSLQAAFMVFEDCVTTKIYFETYQWEMATERIRATGGEIHPCRVYM